MRIVFLLTLVVMLGHAAYAQDGGFAPEDFKSVMKKLPDIVDAEALLSQCPADLAPGDRVSFDNMFEVCSRKPAACLELCSLGNPNACFGVAHILQQNGAKTRGYDGALFARACALGMLLGCANRAAGMMNIAEETGRSALGDANATYQCTFRTFEMTCDADSPWGCMMLGRSLATGRGAGADPDRAKKKLDRACILLPGEGPCETATEWRHWIDLPAEEK